MGRLYQSWPWACRIGRIRFAHGRRCDRRRRFCVYHCGRGCRGRRFGHDIGSRRWFGRFFDGRVANVYVINVDGLKKSSLKVAD